MIAFLLFLILAVLVLYFACRLVNAVVCGIFRAVVAFVMLPWYVGVGVWRAGLLAARFKRWCEHQYIAAERRARASEKYKRAFRPVSHLRL